MTTDVNSDEFTTIPSEASFTTEDNLNVVSEETTTDGTNEVSTSSEISKEHQTSASVATSQSKASPSEEVVPTIAVVKSANYVEDPEITGVSVNRKKSSSSDDLNGNTHSTSKSLPANNQPINQGSVIESSTKGTSLIDQVPSKDENLVHQGVAEEIPQSKTNVDKVKQESHSSQAVDVTRAVNSQLASDMSHALEDITAPYKKTSSSNFIIIQDSSTQSENVGEDTFPKSNIETSSSSSKEQISTPSFSVTKILGKMLTGPMLDSLSNAQLKKEITSDMSDLTQGKTTERQPSVDDTFITSMKKALKKEIINKSEKSPSTDATSGTTPSVSVSSTNEVPTTIGKGSSSDDNPADVVKKSLEKMTKNTTLGISATPKQDSKLLVRITNLTNRLTEEFAKTLNKIITSVLSEPDSTTSTPKSVAIPRGVDIIIPENVHSLKQMDQHLNSKSTSASSKKLVSTNPEGLSGTSDGYPRVEGQPLAGSSTSSPEDVQSTTSSSEE